MQRFRKSLAAALVLILALSLAFPAFADGDEPVSWEIPGLEILPEQHLAVARVVSPADSVLTVALYAEDGRMTGAWSAPVTGAAVEKAVEVKLTGMGEAASAKAFLIAAGSWTPVCEAKASVKNTQTNKYAPDENNLVVTGDKTLTGKYTNVTIASTVGDGEVTLDGATIGTLYVNGGGVNSVYLNKSTVTTVLVKKPADSGSQGVSIKVQGGSTVEEVRLFAGAGSAAVNLVVDEESTVDSAVVAEGGYDEPVTFSGNLENLSVVVEAPTDVRLENGTVKSVELKEDGASLALNKGAKAGTVAVSGNNAAVKVSKDAEVTNLNLSDTAAGSSVVVEDGGAVKELDSKAPDALVTGSGTVEKATVSGSNTEVNTKGTTLTVDEGATGVSQNGEAVTAGATVTTKATEQPAAKEPRRMTVDNSGGTGLLRYSDGSTETRELIPVATSTDLTQWWEGEGDDAAIKKNLNFCGTVDMTRAVRSFPTGDGNEKQMVVLGGTSVVTGSLLTRGAHTQIQSGGVLFVNGELLIQDASMGVDADARLIADGDVYVNAWMNNRGTTVLRGHTAVAGWTGLNNAGDLHVYGTLDFYGKTAENEEPSLINQNGGHIYVHSGGKVNFWQGVPEGIDMDNDVTVEEGGYFGEKLPDYTEAVVIGQPADGVYSVNYDACMFDGTVTVAPDLIGEYSRNWGYEEAFVLTFNNCVFRKDVTVHASRNARIIVDLRDNCVFENGARIRIGSGEGTRDIVLTGARGVTVTQDAGSRNVHVGVWTNAAGGFTLNGVRYDCELAQGSRAQFRVWSRLLAGDGRLFLSLEVMGPGTMHVIGDRGAYTVGVMTENGGQVDQSKFTGERYNNTFENAVVIDKGLEGAYSVSYDACVFEDTVTVAADLPGDYTPGAGDGRFTIRFNNCVFRKDVIVNGSTQGRVWISFGDNCTFENGARVLVSERGQQGGPNGVVLAEIHGADVVLESVSNYVDAWTHAHGGFTFNGMTVDCSRPDGYFAEFRVEANVWDGQQRLNFSASGNGNMTVAGDCGDWYVVAQEYGGTVDISGVTGNWLGKTYTEPVTIDLNEQNYRFFKNCTFEGPVTIVAKSIQPIDHTYMIDFDACVFQADVTVVNGVSGSDIGMQISFGDNCSFNNGAKIAVERDDGVRLVSGEYAVSPDTDTIIIPDRSGVSFRGASGAEIVAYTETAVNSNAPGSYTINGLTIAAEQNSAEDNLDYSCRFWLNPGEYRPGYGHYVSSSMYISCTNAQVTLRGDKVPFDIIMNLFSSTVDDQELIRGDHGYSYNSYDY